YATDYSSQALRQSSGLRASMNASPTGFVPGSVLAAPDQSTQCGLPATACSVWAGGISSLSAPAGSLMPATGVPSMCLEPSRESPSRRLSGLHLLLEFCYRSATRARWPEEPERTGVAGTEVLTLVLLLPRS